MSPVADPSAGQPIANASPGSALLDPSVALRARLLMDEGGAASVDGLTRGATPGPDRVFAEQFPLASAGRISHGG